MANNIAVIDLGSNLTKLLVVSNSLPLNVIHRSVYDTKTLKSAAKGFFDNASIKHIENDIQQILQVANQYNCTTHLGIATSAFRTRSNGQEVITHLNQKFGIQIKIIEGTEEAALIYSGALTSIATPEFPVLVMDIGGGSTEFIIGNKSGVLWKHSFNFGSTALIQGMDISNPLSAEDVKALRQKLAGSLQPLFDQLAKFNPVSFIGTTGAFISFAEIIEHEKGNEKRAESGYAFNLKELDLVLDYLVHANEKDRLATPGLHSLRVPTVHIAALIFQFVLKEITCSTYNLSLGDVKEGRALAHINASYK